MVEDTIFFEFLDDVVRLQAIIKEAGMEVTMNEAEKFWLERSEAWAATWLVLPLNDNDVLQEMLEYSPSFQVTHQ